MVASIAFDTHSYVKKLTGVGFSEEQAEVQAETLARLIEDRLVTKQDLKELETSLGRDIKELETRLGRDIKELETQLGRDLKELEMRLVIRLGGLLVVAVGAMAALVKVL